MIYWHLLTTKALPCPKTGKHWAMSQEFVLLASPITQIDGKNMMGAGYPLSKYQAMQQQHHQQNNQNIQSDEDFRNWKAPNSYYNFLIERLCKAMYDKFDDLTIDEDYEYIDFLNHEYKCRITHLIYCTCVELMVNPEPPLVVAEKLVQQILNVSGVTSTFTSSGVNFESNAHTNANATKFNISQRCNVVAILLINLPRSYRKIFEHRIVEQITDKCKFYDPNFKIEDSENLLKLKTFQSLSGQLQKSGGQINQINPVNLPPNLDQKMLLELTILNEKYNSAVTLALSHAIFYQIGLFELSLLPEFLSTKVKPLITEEKQFLYITHLIGPSLHRIHEYRIKTFETLLTEIYLILEFLLVKKYKPDNNPDNIKMPSYYIRLISDILYYYKYKFLGNNLNVDKVIEQVSKNFPEELQKGMKFILGNNPGSHCSYAHGTSSSHGTEFVAPNIDQILKEIPPFNKIDRKPFEKVSKLAYSTNFNANELNAALFKNLSSNSFLANKQGSFESSLTMSSPSPQGGSVMHSVSMDEGKLAKDTPKRSRVSISSGIKKRW